MIYLIIVILGVFPKVTNNILGNITVCVVFFFLFTVELFP